MPLSYDVPGYTAQTLTVPGREIQGIGRWAFQVKMGPGFLFLALLFSLLHGFGAPEFGASFGDDSLGWLAESENWEAKAEVDVQDGFEANVPHGKSKQPQPMSPSAPKIATAQTASSFVDPSVYDFEVTFSYGVEGIGMVLEERNGQLLVASLEDSKPAELSGLIRKGDQLLAISGEPISSRSSSNSVHSQLRALQEVGWFQLRFRPARLQKRARRQLHDHNVTVQLRDGTGSRLGIVLSTGLTVISILPGQIYDDGQTKVGDILVAVGGEIVTGASLAYVAEFIRSVTGPLVLRFRLPISERRRVDSKSSVGVHVSHGDDGPAFEARMSTFEVRFETLQSLGLEISDRLVVTGFRGSTRDGGASPAEQTGRIQIGDTVVSVNDDRAIDAPMVRRLLAQKTHEEVLRCRGNKVTRYCSIERVQPTSTARVVVFSVGPRQRHGERTYPDLGLERGSARSRAAAIREQIEVAPSFGAGSRSAAVGVTVARGYHVELQGNAIDEQNERKKGATALAPSGFRESVFRTPRGLAVSKNFTADFSTALFGGALWCGARRLVVASPINGCQALIEEEKLRDAYAVVRRGGCFFTSKAINAQFAGAAGIIVIDHKPIANSYVDPSQILSPASLLPMRMPASSRDAHLINIPAVMVTYDAGERLLAEVRSCARGQELFLKLELENPDKSSCPVLENFRYKQNGTYSPNMNGPKHPPKPVLRTDQAGGRLFIRRDNTRWRDLEFATALFSGPFEHGTLTDRHVVLANPINGCSIAASEAGKYHGALVIAKRGDCALVEKAMLAQKMHASAIVIVNDRSCALERMQSWMTLYQPGRSKSGEVNIPAVLVSKHAGNKLIASLVSNNNNDNTLAEELEVLDKIATSKAVEDKKVSLDKDLHLVTYSAHLQANSSHLDLWERLGAVKSPSSWPADKSARDDLFTQLAVLHHPDKPTGHIDRYECLVAARESVERYHLHKKIVRDQ